MYTNLLYKILYGYHKLPFDTAVDLGCGPVCPYFGNPDDRVL